MAKVILKCASKMMIPEASEVTGSIKLTKAAAPWMRSRYINSALVTQMQLHKRSHTTASVLIRFINIMKLH